MIAGPSRASKLSAVLVVALLALVAGMCLFPVTESDLFFRVKVGQEILAHHRLMASNTFSFTAPEHPDLDLAWLFEIAAALAFRVGGFPGVVLLKTALVGAAFGVAVVACRRRGASTLATVLALAGAAVVMRERFVERPHVVSFIGEAGVLAALGDVRRPWSRGRLSRFVALVILWANAHAGVFSGALLLGAAALGWAIAGDRRAARRAALLAAIAGAAAFATPVGFGLVRYLALHVWLPRIHTIDEFRAATWRSDPSFFAGAVLVLALVIVSIVVERRRPRAANATALASPADRAPHPLRALAPELAPVAVALLLGFASVRFSADAVLVAAPLVAARATALGRALRSAAPVPPDSAPAPSLGVALVLLTATLGPRLSDVRAGRPFLSINLDPAIVPWDAIAFVDDNGLRERMYNDFETGSYLAFQGYPRWRVFIDPRLPAYPEELHRLLGDFDLDRAAWDRAMDRYGVQSALLAYAGVNRRVAWWDPERWALVYRAGDARVFVRRLPQWNALIAAREIPATFTFAVETGTATLPLETRPAASPVSDCEWQRRLGDLLFDLDAGVARRARAHYDQALATPGCLARSEEAALSSWLGATALGDRAFERALALCDRALALDPSDVQTRANRALALEGLGRRADARLEWQRLAEEAPATPAGKVAATRLGRPAVP